MHLYKWIVLILVIITISMELTNARDFGGSGNRNQDQISVSNGAQFVFPKQFFFQRISKFSHVFHFLGGYKFFKV